MTGREGRSRLWERYSAWLGVVLCGALVLSCYGYALRLPFFFDDLPVMTWLGGRDLLDIWTTSSENAYYRPLTFTIYKLGLAFPKGTQQVVLHAANLSLYWASAVLLLGVLLRLDSSPERHLKAVLSASLYAVFPFVFRAVPWVTAMPHFLVVALTLIAVYAALRAEGDRRPAWWALSFGTTAVAPFAHESGLVCGAIVAGIVLIRYGIGSRPGALSGARQGAGDGPVRSVPGGQGAAARRTEGLPVPQWTSTVDWRRVVFVVLGGLLNLGALWLRRQLPGTGAYLLDGLNSPFENAMFALHGLIYPLGPALGYLVHHWGWHDFALIGVASLLLALLLTWQAIRRRGWRWLGGALWWWFWGSLPTVLRFRYGGLVNSPRFYALASIGIVMIWAGVIVNLASIVRPTWGRHLAWGVLAAAIVVPNLAFLSEQRQVHLALNHVYERILEAAADPDYAPLGFVNLPAWLAPVDQTYPLTKDGAVYLPLYTNVREFIAVNRGSLDADNVMYVHTLYELEDAYFGFHGDWPDWEGMHQFAVDHRTVWQTRLDETGALELRHVGSIRAGEGSSVREPLAWYEGGPVLESASVHEVSPGRWAIALDWLASGPANGEIFCHVVDARGELVTQADGPALGGMVPMWTWQDKDRVYDVRYIVLPEGSGPCTVLVGVYDGSHRFPAFEEGARYLNDAAPVATVVP